MNLVTNFVSINKYKYKLSINYIFSNYLGARRLCKHPPGAYNTSTALKSFTLVWVGPVTTKSPKAAKKP